MTSPCLQFRNLRSNCCRMIPNTTHFEPAKSADFTFTSLRHIDVNASKCLSSLAQVHDNINITFLHCTMQVIVIYVVYAVFTVSILCSKMLRHFWRHWRQKLTSEKNSFLWVCSTSVFRKSLQVWRCQLKFLNFIFLCSKMLRHFWRHWRQKLKSETNYFLWVCSTSVFRKSPQVWRS